MIKRIKNFIQKKLSNLNKSDVIVSILTALICMIYKYFAENWYSLGFILLFVCMKYVFLIVKSIVCKENIDEVHLIKLMLLSLIFVFLQMVLFYLKMPQFWFRVAVSCTVILINFVLRVIVLHKLCFTV